MLVHGCIVLSMGSAIVLPFMEIIMAGKPSTGQEAAKRQFDRAPADKKPSAIELAVKHGLAESTIHRSKWYVAYKNERKQVKK